MTRELPDQATASGSALELETWGAEETRDLGRRLAGLLAPGDVVVLSGGLGAGKTTLAQGIGAGLGVRGDVTSPTFVISRVHRPAGDGPPLVHVDAYRLHDGAELDDLDLDETRENAVTVVEWGDGLAEVLSPDRLRVHLRPRRGAVAGRPPGRGTRRGVVDEGDEARVVTVEAVGRRWHGIPLAAVLDGS